MLSDMPQIGLAERAPSGRRPDVLRAWVSGLRADPRARYVLGVVTLAVLYRGAAQIGYALQFAGPVASIVWLPVGVGIAFLYVGGLRYWPGVLIGDLLANDYTALPLGSALGQTSGNVLEIVAATLLLRTLVPDGDPLASAADLANMLVAIGIGTAVSATVGSLSLWLGDVVAGDALQDVWRTWWLGDASGALVVLPLALAWARLPSRSWWRRRGAEVVAMLVVLVAVNELALRAEQPLVYLAFPALMWAGLRLGRRGATLAVAVAAGFAIWETTRQVGPFAYESITDSVLITQLYIGVSALSTMFLAVVVAEREAFAAHPRGIQGTARRDRRQRAPADRAQPPRWGSATPDRAPRPAAESAPSSRGPLPSGPPASSRRPGRSCRRRSTSCGSSPTASTPRRSPPTASRRRCGRWPRDRPSRSELLELPADRVDETAEATAYFVFCEAVANAQQARGGDLDTGARRDVATRSPHRDRRRRARGRDGANGLRARGPPRPGGGDRRQARDRQPGRERNPDRRDRARHAGRALISGRGPATPPSARGA